MQCSAEDKIGFLDIYALCEDRLDGWNTLSVDGPMARSVADTWRTRIHHDEVPWRKYSSLRRLR